MQGNKNMLVLIFILLIANTISGPFATAACALECSVTLATGPGYVVCMTLCITLEAPLLCFSEKTLIVTRTGTKQISQIQLGQQVLTANQTHHEQWTTVIFKKKEKASQFVKIETDFETLEVTLEHVMIIGEKLMKAKDLQIGMMIQNKPIKKLSFLQKDWKVTLATQSGTVLANGLLTTTICGDYIVKYGDGLEVLTQWRKDHEWLMMQ